MLLANIFSLLGQQSKGPVHVAGFALKLHAGTTTAQFITLNQCGRGQDLGSGPGVPVHPQDHQDVSVGARREVGVHHCCLLLADLGRALESLSLGVLTPGILVQPSHFICLCDSVNIFREVLF